MKETEWEQCDDIQAMLAYVRGKKKITQRQLRLLYCARCRQVWPLLVDERSRRAVELAEQYADYPADRNVFDKAHEEAWMASTDAPKKASEVGARLALSTVTEDGFGEGFWESALDLGLGEDEQEVLYSAASREPDILRDVMGNPLTRHPAIKHSLLTPTVIDLAQAIYDQRAFERMPDLGRALEEAGCSDKDILDHCFTQEVHVRGCWVVDLILDKG